MNSMLRPASITFLLALAFVSSTSAFQPFSISSQTKCRLGSSLGVLYDPRSADDEFVDFPTPAQRVFLKAEASRRQAWKEIATFSIPPEETDGPFSVATLQSLWSDLSQNELVLVRGLSKSDKKFVWGTAERICAELETVQSDLPVSLISTKGHTAVIFCPSLPLEDPLHVPLRTSVGQKNTWRARVKPPRDERGQVIKE
jgi:hypothetical protein